MSHEYTSYKVLLKNRSYACYVASALLAMLSYGMSYIALTWIVLHYEGGGIKPVVILMVCFWLPSVVLSPFAGVIVDRVSRRKLFIFTSWSRGVLLLGLGLIEWKYQSLTAIYVISILEGVVSCFVLPTVTALVREIVLEKQLLAANTFIDSIYESGNVMGMALAGFAIAWLSNAGSLIADGLLFFVATLFSYGIKTPYASTVKPTRMTIKNVYQEMYDGLVYIIKRTDVKVVYTLELVALVLYMVVPVLTAPFARQYLHANVTEFGYLEALLSIGVVLGNIIAPTIVRWFGLLKVLLIYNILLVICFSLFAVNRDLNVACALNFLIGIGFASWSLLMTRAQEVTELSFQGRVASSFNSLSSVAMLLVYALLYFEGPFIKIDLLYFVQVGLAVLTIVMVLRYYKLFKL